MVDMDSQSYRQCFVLRVLAVETGEKFGDSHSWGQNLSLWFLRCPGIHYKGVFTHCENILIERECQMNATKVTSEKAPIRSINGCL